MTRLLNEDALELILYVLLSTLFRHNDDGSFQYGYEAADGSYKGIKFETIIVKWNEI